MIGRRIDVFTYIEKVLDRGSEAAKKRRKRNSGLSREREREKRKLRVI